MNRPTLNDEPVEIKRSTTSGKLLRNGEALYNVRLAVPLPGGCIAQYWMIASEVAAFVRGGTVAIG